MDMTDGGTPDTIGTAIAHKKINDHDVVAIAIRGEKYEQEWVSNFIAGLSGDANGFADAAVAKIAADTIACLNKNFIFSFLSRLNQLPSNRPSPDVVQFDFHVVARLHDLAFFGLENHLLEVVGAAAQFRLVAHGVLFHQQFLGAAEHHLVTLERDGVLQFHQARVALVLFGLGERLRFLV